MKGLIFVFVILFSTSAFSKCEVRSDVPRYVIGKYYDICISKNNEQECLQFSKSEFGKICQWSPWPGDRDIATGEKKEPLQEPNQFNRRFNTNKENLK